MSEAMDRAIATMTDAVAATEGVEASAGELITRIANEQAANKDNPEAIQALSDRLLAAKGSLAAAIAAVPAGPAGSTTTEPATT